MSYSIKKETLEIESFRNGRLSVTIPITWDNDSRQNYSYMLSGYVVWKDKSKPPELVSL